MNAASFILPFTFCLFTSRSHLVALAESVSPVRYRKGTILLGGNLDPMSGPVVGWRRRRAGTDRGCLNRRDRHVCRLLVYRVGDEQPRHGVLLPAQLREVQLPQILETRRRMKDLHRIGLSSFSRAIV